MFFILEQIIHKPDRRYDTFLANVLQRENEWYDKLVLPDDIRILSWNYDNQLELVYREYLEKNYSEIREILGIYDVKSDEKERSLKDKCSIIKLNGTANFLKEEDWLQYSGIDKIDDTMLGNILKKYTECLIAGRCEGRLRLNFAWEERWSEDMLNKRIPNMVRDATALVVIGYTFPYFNRKIDRVVFKEMSNLKNIYIQDPYADRIKQNIIPVMPNDKLTYIKIHTLNDVDQFFLPPEL